jgi:hypothetical protein
VGELDPAPSASPQIVPDGIVSSLIHRRVSKTEAIFGCYGGAAAGPLLLGLIVSPISAIAAPHSGSP